MSFWNEFSGPNAAYALELYERYLKDPASVDATARLLFERWGPPPEPHADLDSKRELAGESPPSFNVQKVVGIANLAEAIREYGHLAAQLDPLGSPPIGDPALNPAAHGIGHDDLAQFPASLIGGPIALRARSAAEAIDMLREVYCASTGYDFDHIRNPEEREWLRFAAESRQFFPPQDPINPEALLQRLTEVEAFEQFLHRIFPGKHRFSIEGLDMMVPILDEITGAAAETGRSSILIGMAHRGRLNVLAHLLNKPYAQIFAEFKDPVQEHLFRDDLGWTGDVKYHLGARRALQNGTPVAILMSMAPNPSHLEFVNPVVEGMARAAGTRVDQAGPPIFDTLLTLPILIHGDAAFPGQGVVAETLNLSRLAGYWTGGTLHIIANNQLGYTTEASEGRSTLYASDLAKGFKIPVIHVNADDPEACIAAARLAFAYLSRFQRDFVIDLVGYRRHGHNEGDEPAFTQPRMYQQIEKHPTVRALWARTLVERKAIDAERADILLRQQMDRLQGVLETLDPERDLLDPRPLPPEPGAARRVKTSIGLGRLRELNRALLTFPEGFTPHPKLQRMINRRLQTTEEEMPLIDWSTAESLALASILEDGTPIRMTGQDVQRGTFSQRHAVFHDVHTGERFVPLQALPQAKAAFEIHNSPLSEAAALGFEYGYNVQAPERLVIWEAQYGDFDNGAQVIIDEFIVSARAKWGQTPSLVLLLPHGYEGAGPDHSSARPERFLQLAAETNLRIANPTTAAQYFHLLRRQALLLKSDPLPLIVLTPKSLLRHPKVSSPLTEFAEGRWHPVLDDPDAAERAAVQRLLLCSGKLYVDLATDERRAARPDLAIVRVEQLYPFPQEDLRKVLRTYPNLLEVVWAQEEPENMGAWEFVRPYLISLMLERKLPLRYIGRPRNASPAEGSSAWHQRNQMALIEQAFTPQAQLDDPVIKQG
jgi:2-oxoglutarate dehydrogenase E1 component